MAKRFPIVVVLLLIAELSFSQSFYAVRRNRSLIFSAGTGTSTYFGELSNPGDYVDARPNLNVGLQYFLLPRVNVRAEATWYQLSGSDAKADDPDRIPRNLSFVSNNYEIALSGAVHLFPNGNRYYQRPVFNAYAFLGIGFTYINPKAELDGTRHALQPLQTEGVTYSRFQPVVPYGLGVKLKMGPFFNIAIEGGYRMTFTDYLDDASTVHPDKTGWDPLRIALSDRGPELGEAPYLVGVKRGNPDTNDGYFLMNVKIEYYLPSTFTFGNSSKQLYKQKRRSSRRR
jgi:hypothetical protein